MTKTIFTKSYNFARVAPSLQVLTMLTGKKGGVGCKVFPFMVLKILNNTVEVCISFPDFISLSLLHAILFIYLLSCDISSPVIISRM